MYRLHYWPTPNGHKITLFLEEAGLAYEVVPVNIGAGDQFRPEFLAISPNNRIPALEDTERGVHLFESGAILLYLATKHQRFIPADPSSQAYLDMLSWLFWQMGGLGPMLGQSNHFRDYAPEKIPYAIKRYTNEGLRLLHVMNERLRQHPFLAGNDYTIADIAAHAWAKSGVRHLGEGQDLSHLRRWLDGISARPAAVRAYAVGERPEFHVGPRTAEQNRLLFHQGPETVRQPNGA